MSKTEELHRNVQKDNGVHVNRDEEDDAVAGERESERDDLSASCEQLTKPWRAREKKKRVFLC